MRSTPNILMVVSDQHRGDWLEGEPDGPPVRTPTLRRLAARGATFTDVVTPAPLCAPARACLATGRHYDANPVRDNLSNLPLDLPTYYRQLRDEAGYHVAGVGKFDLHKATLDWNADGSRLLEEWGFCDGVDSEGKFDSLWSGWPEPHGPYMGHLHDRGLAESHIEDFRRRARSPYGDVALSPLPEDAYLDNWIAANAMAALRRRPSDAPWHLVVNFAGPHDPMDVTEPMRRAWEGVDFPEPVRPGNFAGDHQEVRRRYAAMIENIDRHVARFLEVLQEGGELDDTIVIYTSDHGEMLGDHGVWGKQIPLGPSLRVPLVVAGPGVAAGLRSEALVTLEDVAAYVLDVAGLQPAPGMTARSFRSVVEGSSEGHRAFTVSGLDRGEVELSRVARHYGTNFWVGLRSWRAVSTPELKLVASPELDHPLLFDRVADPTELHDVAQERPEQVRALLEMLHSAVGPYPDGTVVDGGAER